MDTPDTRPQGPYLYTDGNAYAVVPDPASGWGVLMVAPLEYPENNIDHTQWAEFEPAGMADHRFLAGAIVALLALREAA